MPHKKKSTHQNKSDLTKGNLLPIIARLALPMMLGIAAVYSVSIVDTYFVGKLGTDQLAALSFTFPVAMAIASLSSGLGAGAGSVVARAIGSNDKARAKRLATDALLLASTIVIALTLIGYTTIDSMFRLLGATDNTLPFIKSYMRIWYLSMPFLVIPIVANSVIRSVGNAFWPGTIMVAAALINIALTPLFIFGYGPLPAMNIEGAAISTLIARVLTFVLALYVAYYKESIIEVCVPTWHDFVASCRSVLKIALPAGTGSVVNPIGIGIVTGILATFGSETVAAFGVATRIESFAIIPMLALSASIGPIAGQNWGANNKRRVINAVKYCYALCALWTLIVVGIFYFFAAPLSALLASNESVAQHAEHYLTVVGASLVGYGLIIVSAATFNSLGRPISGLTYYVSRTFVFYVPLSVIAKVFYAANDVFIAIAIANVISGLLVSAYCMRWLKKAVENDIEPRWNFEISKDSL